MKKPVMPKGAELDKIVAKRKHKKVTITKSPPVGGLDAVTKAVADFAIANDVPTADVKFGRQYYQYVMKLTRRETDAELRARVLDDVKYKHRMKMYDYDRWLTHEAARKEREAAELPAKVKEVQKAIDAGTIKVKCDHQCACK